MNYRLATSGLILKDSKILLIQREHKPYKGRWTLPGGKVNQNESVDDALKRELQEEVGLQVDIQPICFIQYQKKFVYIELKQNFLIYTKLCNIISQQTPKEVINTQFFTLKEFSELPEKKCTPLLQIICHSMINQIQYVKQ